MSKIELTGATWNDDRVQRACRNGEFDAVELDHSPHLIALSQGMAAYSATRRSRSSYQSSSIRMAEDRQQAKGIRNGL